MIPSGNVVRLDEKLFIGVTGIMSDRVTYVGFQDLCNHSTEANDVRPSKKREWEARKPGEEVKRRFEKRKSRAAQIRDRNHESQSHL